MIDVEYQILTPVDPYIRAQIVERLTKGTVRFDIERGRVIQQQHEVDRREVGFAAQQNASSMHFVARTQERLLEGEVGRGQRSAGERGNAVARFGAAWRMADRWRLASAVNLHADQPESAMLPCRHRNGSCRHAIGHRPGLGARHGALVAAQPVDRPGDRRGNVFVVLRDLFRRSRASQTKSKPSSCRFDLVHDHDVVHARGRQPPLGPAARCEPPTITTRSPGLRQSLGARPRRRCSG